MIDITLTAREIGLLILIGGIVGALITGIATGRFGLSDIQSFVGIVIGIISSLSSGVWLTRGRNV